MKVSSINQIGVYAFKKPKIARENQTYPQNNSISNIYYTYPDSLNFCGLFKAKKVDFKKAQTFQEAQDFGYNKFWIIKYVGFDDNTVDIMNYINEALVSAQNAHQTTLRMPEFVDLRDLGTSLAKITNRAYSTLFLNSTIYSPDKIDDEIFRLFDAMTDDGVILNSKDGSIINPLLSNEEADEFFKGVSYKLNSDFTALSYDEKIDFYSDLRKIYERTSSLNHFPKYVIIKLLEAGCWGEIKEDKIKSFEQSFMADKERSNFKQLFEFLESEGKAKTDFVLDLSKFNTIYHELGHLQSNRFDHCPAIYNYRNPKDYIPGLVDWLSDKEKMRAAFKVSPYACSGIGEFIAESYAWLLQGKELPKEALFLYNKLHGPKVQLRRD